MFLVKVWKEDLQLVPSFEQTLAQLQEQGHQVGGPAVDPNMHPLDLAAATTMGVPVLGDIVGLAADARMFAQEPESRTPLNIGLSAAGLLPFVPGAAAIMRGIKGAERSGEEVKLTEAQRMAEEGLSPADIWDETGWYQGVDEQWRSEIPDFKSRVNIDNLEPKKPGFLKQMFKSVSGSNISGGQLQDVLEHPDFFRNYPDFNPTVVTYYDPRGKAFAEYNELDDIISINLSPHYDEAKDIVGDIESPEYLEEVQNQIKDTLLHEVQHGVQSVEDFAGGGDVYDPFYKQLAGEVEARTVGKRARVPEDYLRTIKPFEEGAFAMDVPAEEQVVRIGQTRVNE